MLAAALSAFLFRQPLGLQALFVGACLGAFLTGVVSVFDPGSSTELLVVAFLCFAIASGGFFYVVSSRSQRAKAEGESSGEAETSTRLPTYQLAIFALIWLVGIAAAVLNLFIGAGFAAAVILVLPIVLFAPVALGSAREIAERHRS